MEIADLNGNGTLDIICSLGIAPGQTSGALMDGLMWYEGGDPTKGVQLYCDGAPLKTLPPAGNMMEDLREIQIVDWNRDGKPDILVGTGGIYYWRDPAGMNKQGDDPPAYIFYYENIGTPGDDNIQLTFKGRLQYGDDTVNQDGEKDIRISGNASPFVADWDNDGDMDLLSGQWYTYMNFFENIAVDPNVQPVLTAGTRITLGNSEYILPEDDPLPAPVVLDYDQDGLQDLIVVPYSSIYYFLKNVGTKEEPRFETAELIQGIKQPINIGAFMSAEAIDWNGDGNIDLIAGNENGVVVYYENLGDWMFAQKQYMTANGKMINHDAGDFEFVPIERYYGYTMPSIGDWNNDGKLDMLISDIRGNIKIYLGKGNSSIDFEECIDVYKSDGTILKSASRTRVKMMDWNKDGVMDIICFNRIDGSLTVYYGQGGGTVSSDGKILTLLGSPIRCLDNLEQARHTFDIVDWNNDGKWDILHTPTNRGVIRYYENIGTNEEPDFADRGRLAHKGEFISDALHYAFVHAVDFNGDGFLDLISAADHGVIKFYDGRFITWHKN